MFVYNEKKTMALLEIPSAMNVEGFKVPCNIAVYTQS